MREVGRPRHRDRHRHRHAPRRRARRRPVVGDMPVVALVDDCPLYDLEPAKPDRAAVPGAAAGARPPARAPRRRCSRCSRSPNIASRLPLFQQYDWIVQSRTVRRPERGRRRGAAAAERATRSRRRSTATGGKVAADPYWGTVGVVLECASNLACVGAEPLGTTNNLNFGNPEKPHIAWQLTEAVRGHRRRLPRARRADRRRQRLALQRGRRGPDLPDAGHRHGRRAARRRARRPARLRPRRRRVGPRRLERHAVARRRPSSPSCAARRCPTGCRRSTSPRCAPRRRRSARRCAPARCRARHDVAEGGFLVAVAECCLAGGRRRDARRRVGRRRLDRRAAVRRGAGRVRRLGAARGARAPRRAGRARRLRHGRRRRARRSAPSCAWSLDELREAHRALAPLFP